MEKEHMVIIGLIVIILIMIVGFVGIFTNTNLLKTTPNTNTTGNNSSIATTNGSITEPTTTSTTTIQSETSDTEKQEEGDSLDRSGKIEADPLYKEDNDDDEDEYVEINEYSSSSDGNYLSSDDYYVSDMGFVISKHHN